MDIIKIKSKSIDKLKHNAKSIQGFTSDLMHISCNLNDKDKRLFNSLCLSVDKELKIIDDCDEVDEIIIYESRSIKELKHNAKTIQRFMSDLTHIRCNLNDEDKITFDLLYSFADKELKIIDDIYAKGNRTKRIYCNKCCKELDYYDIQGSQRMSGRFRYGSKYDLQTFELNLCCDCFDKFIESLEIQPFDD